MKLSLRARLFALVLAINLAVFALGTFFLLERIESRSQRGTEALADGLEYTISGTIRPGEDFNAARILAWPSWAAIEDALLVDRNVDELHSGRLQPRGVALNPVGSARRLATFDQNAVLQSVMLAMRERRPIDGVAGGRAVPILVSSRGAPTVAREGRMLGQTWGGCWYRVRSELTFGQILRDLLPWFLGSTLLLTAGTFLMLRELVLRPVEAMAEASRRIESGDLSARVPESVRGDELAALTRAFNAMTAKVEGFNQELAAQVQRATEQARRAEAAAMTQRRLAAMGELAAGIAHEINNPLGGLINAAEALARPELPAPKREQYLGLLREGLERIHLTVSQLLRFTPRAASPQPLLLSEVARDAVALVRHRAERMGVALVHTGLLAEPSVSGLRNELGQVLLNLLVNALDALEGRPRGTGRVDVSLEQRGRELVLRVADNGPGMPAELLARAADLFFSTKEVGRGTGLGLSIAHSIAQQHKGRLVLSSESGRGFTAELCLPLNPPAAGAEAR